MSDLKPCPFCDGEAEFERIGTERYSTVVVCTDCGARHESCDVREFAGLSWNNRPAENKIKADAVRGALEATGANSLWACYFKLKNYADKLERGDV